jgi:hypothetical protein
MAPMGRLEDKAEKVRALGLDVSGRGTRPNGGTEGLYINSSFFDEQFVDQIIVQSALYVRGSGAITPLRQRRTSDWRASSRSPRWNTIQRRSGS